MHEKEEQLVISLVFDEMDIQRTMSWCRASNKFIGLIDYGTPNINDEFTLGKSVIVFMACGLNAHFQQPVGFYFIQTLKGSERSVLLLHLAEISRRGIIVGNITFDGYKANATMCKHLGAKLKLVNGEYVTYFINPHDGKKVYIILDPSHMIKLIRINPQYTRHSRNHLRRGR